MNESTTPVLIGTGQVTDKREPAQASTPVELMAEVARQTARHGTAPNRPPFWGGYRIRPLEIEFWANGTFRLHDRFRWRRKTVSGEWNISRLHP